MASDLSDLTPSDSLLLSVEETRTMDVDDGPLLELSERPSKPATLLSYEEVRPQSFTGRRKSSRVQQYRRRLRRQRNRRIAVGIAVTATTLALGLAYKIQHPEFQFQQFVSVDDLNVSVLDQLMDAAANQTLDTWSYLSGKNSIVEEPKKEPSKKRIPKLEKVVEDEPPKVIENPEPIPEVPKTTTTPVVVPKETKEEVQLVLTQPPKERRPPLCNIPLAYVHPRCRRLARTNPVFNLHALVQDMMQ